jgi:uncharacterized repeat protein (TIGR01451 family)/LPXTG-motif cell wall-anchored protein
VTVEPADDPKPGDQVTYQVDVVNPTGLAGSGWRLVAPIPTGLVDVRWSCTASGQGYGCGAASGTGDLDEAVSFGVDGRLTYLVSGAVDPSRPVPFTFEVSLFSPDGLDCGQTPPATPPVPPPSEVESMTIDPDLTGLLGGQSEHDPEGYGHHDGFDPESADITLDTFAGQPEGAKETEPQHKYPGKDDKKKHGKKKHRGEPCKWRHSVTPAQPPTEQLPVTGAPAAVLALVGAGSAVAGGALWWWAGRRRQVRRTLRG